LNKGVLPRGYYALAEQVAGGRIPDVLTLQEIDNDRQIDDEPSGGTAVATEPPRVSISVRMEQALYAVKSNRLAIRRGSSDRVVALVEIVSAGNKGSQRDFKAFVDKAADAYHQGINLLIIDLYPPTSRDPQGIHGAIWGELGGEPYLAPPGKPLTLASYVGEPEFAAYVEPIAVGDILPPMPLFLSPTHYVNVPLEESYLAAVAEIPDRAREPLEA
ncbi:MAG: DUF4058 family protein, partial [Pirellulaceae bacterium]|nr:DUF4058 family protein [Pirellulaceae bacterium]